MEIARHFPVIVVIVPLLVAVIIPVASMLRRGSAWFLCVFATGVSFAVSLALLAQVHESGRISYWFGGWEPPWGIEYAIDYLNGYVLVVVTFMALLSAIYARNSVIREIDEGRHTFFYSAFMLLITGLIGIVVTGDIFNVYVFLEISSLSGYALIAVGRRREALTASYNYLILGTIGATFILMGIGHLYMMTGSLNMADLAERLPPLYESRVVITALALFTVGFALKIALFPLHIWMPNAYSTAPSVVGALLAATATKVGAYVMFRVLFTVFGAELDLSLMPIMKILLVMACVAIIAGSVLAVAQRNLKRMLAYSSVGQIGYIVLGATLINQSAMTGSLIHILNHALMKGSLFFVAGAVIYSAGIEDIAGLKGLAKKMPITMAAFTIGALSMIGVPLTVGFVSKWYLAVGALNAGMWYVVVVILISSLLSAVYFWRIIESLYFAKSEISDSVEVSDPPAGMLTPIVLSAGLCVFFGVMSWIPLSVAGKAASMLLGGGN